MSATTGTYTVETLRTGDVAPPERARYWHERTGGYQSRMAYAYPHTEDFRGRTVCQRTSTYQIVRYWSDRIEYARTARQIRADPDEDYRFLVPLGGSMLLRQDGQETSLAPGSGALITFSAPFECRQAANTGALLLTVPAREIDGPLSRRSPLATVPDLTTGLGRVISSMLGTLYSERDNLTAGHFDAVTDRIVEMLCMLATGDDRPDASGHLAGVEKHVRRYVREHAADPGLTGGTVARRLGWSLRQVQLALQRAGTTPRELIREERLRLVRDRLRSAGCDHLTIADLAHASGFSSASALSTAFRQRYGVSPREMRHGG
ncbi:helix-turn-helix domain-containing protein [Streptomyces sp. NPDC048172]|uniref:AraC-like ligand-binding domain-containing protein n=1 Tax=Streptomyces sp. NPDC048172 TaxID=3365505 RepID=UPI003718EAAA